MKRIVFIIAVCLFGISTLVHAKVRALLSYSIFTTPDNKPYVETYLSVLGKSVQFVKSDNGKYQGTVEVSLTFKDNESVKYTDKYNLLSPETDDTLHLNFNFLDQQRIPLPNGDYNFEISIKDKNTEDIPFTYIQKIKIDFPVDQISISDIQAIESYKKSEANSPLSKSGYDLMPMVDNYYPSEIKFIKFYAEVYNADKVLGSDQYLLTYFIESGDRNRPLDKFKVFSKQQPKDVTVLLSEFPIEELYSGNYNLVVEARNNKNDLLARKEYAFQRNNNVAEKKAEQDFSKADVSNTFVEKMTDKKELADYVSSLHPISNAIETSFEENETKNIDITILQQFFYNFWLSRNSGDPEGAWIKYNNEVQKINELYGTKAQKGYATDRGRVYLQYGPPNDVQQSYYEPSSYPYEIWQYYKIKNQTNRKFIFYSRDRASNMFVLLHSDANGEPYEDQWRIKLQQRYGEPNDFDTQYTRDHMGGKANDIFKDSK